MTNLHTAARMARDAMTAAAMWLPLTTQAAGLNPHECEIELSDFPDGREPEKTTIASTLNALRAASDALDQALEQPQQEPVCVCELTCVCGAVWQGEELVSTPPRREWVGLTDDGIRTVYDDCDAATGHEFILAFARAIEAKLKERNAS